MVGSAATSSFAVAGSAVAGFLAVLGSAGMPAVTAASSAWVLAANAWPTRWSNSPLASRSRTNATLSASITCSRSACDARSLPSPWPAAAAISSPGPAITAPPHQRDAGSLTPLLSPDHPPALGRVPGGTGGVVASRGGGPAEGPVGELVHRPAGLPLEPVVVTALRIMSALTDIAV